MARRKVDNGDDILDSRDVIKALQDKTDDRDSANVTEDTDPDVDRWTAQDGTVFDDSWTEDDESEYQILKAFAEEGEGLADWLHGEALIRDSYFETYAREMAEDIGALKDADHWPCTCIDWERAADELKQDYTSIEFDGVTYWGRS